MTPREAFRRLMSYRPSERLPVLAIEPFEEEALARWRGEGLPAGVHPVRFLGMSRLVHVPVGFGPIPGFEERVLSEDADSFMQVTGMGAVVRRRRDHPTMFYGHLDHPVKTPADWEEYRKRFDAATPGRLPADWESRVAPALNASDDPVGISFFPFFFRLGFYALGMERFLTAFHEEPALIHAMFAHWSEFVLGLLPRVLARVRLDFASFNEDLAGKSGPLVSPRTYEEFWRPHQEPILRMLREHGVPVISQWSAGQFEALLPGMREQGFNAAWPCEAMAGMDPLALRRRHGKGLLLAGGISKEAVLAGPAAIDREIERLTPLIRAGGFIPALDDMASPDMPFAHYRYLIGRLQAIRL